MYKKPIGFVETPELIAELMVKLTGKNKNSLTLDTGCGRGVFLKKLQEYGFNNVYGIEMNKEFYKLCKEKYPQYEILAENFLTKNFKERFDLIMGNPPYVHYSDLPKRLSKQIKKIAKNAEADIYYAFIIKSIELLKEEGELIYIVPYHFFFNTHAAYLRNFMIKNGSFEIIIDLGEIRLFSKNPETIIFKYKKGIFEKKIKVLNIKNQQINDINKIRSDIEKVLEEKKSSELFEYYELPPFKKNTVWSTSEMRKWDIQEYKLLKDIAKIGVGFVSGYKKAFYISENEYQKMDNSSKELIKPFIKAKNCDRYIVNGFHRYIFIDKSIEEKILKEKYPEIYIRLLKHKKEMSERFLPGRTKWYQWQAARNYKFLMENPGKRIYVPALDRKPYNRFSFSEESYFPSGDVLFIQPYLEKDIYFLLGYLNSLFFREYYISYGGKRGGRMSFTQKLLENIKIPEFDLTIQDEISHITKEIIRLKKQKKETKIYEEQIEEVIKKNIKKIYV
ncbi:Eco57I restriction endonuclease [Marinitoga piezophila KA3]|uniref:site-specific DNA-methyltransferase (adenine-specific) n=1 Tax=Marinitoga piezophila (strain DSM 14283 / JCM 11233 / KA3) TaxID=443254 RepID=H2J7L6_MARPK|nr:MULTISPECIES: class I SAM-dependent methyltransferase [Marinitoga]AEX85357.1 Eco57I restriction endonuclease [Marinitoga piezophila KA3]APT75835.1 hypothetical protein LN42_05185 [Marinitoga sp. 1137]